MTVTKPYRCQTSVKGDMHSFMLPEQKLHLMAN